MRVNPTSSGEVDSYVFWNSAAGLLIYKHILRFELSRDHN